MRNDSIKSTKQFYRKLKAEGLKARTKKKWDVQIIRKLKSMIDKEQKILDVGCGYGRITVPLAKAGYDIEGVDLMPSLIKDAKRYAKKEGVSVKFKIGNICNLPYEENSFDVIICMWTAFNELLKYEDQLAAICSMKRVLKHGGCALFEGALPKKNAKGLIKFTTEEGATTYHYNHNKKTFSKLMKAAKIKNYKIYTDDFAGRRRQVLWFRK